jgi:hypothetical protein
VVVTTPLLSVSLLGTTVPTAWSSEFLWNVIVDSASPVVLQVNLASPPLATFVILGGSEMVLIFRVAVEDFMKIVPHLIVQRYSPAASSFI